MMKYPHPNIDDYKECECGTLYDDRCRTCYYNNAPEDVWIKKPKNFDLPSFLDFMVYTPQHDTSILIVSFCDTDRYYCKYVHTTGIDCCGMGEKRYTDLPIRNIKYWRKLPKEPE